MSTTSSEPTALLLRLIGGDPAAAAEVIASAATSQHPPVLVAAALVSHDPSYLVRAGALALTVRDRQLVVLAHAHLKGQSDRFDALVRDHLADHPDHLLAAWIAGQQPSSHPTPPHHQEATPMSTITVTPIPTTHRLSTKRVILRWMLSFLGFPLGGLAAWVLVGPVIDTTSAVTGGLLTGAMLGAVQGWALRADRRQLIAWTLATAVGMAAGLAVGSFAAGYATSLGDLVLQGVLTGSAVGLAQAAALWRRTGPPALAWPVYLALAWGAGWGITTLAGIGVDEQFTVFGSSGALVATLLTAVLPLVLRTRSVLSPASAA